jgi:hypothetical protein
MGASKWIAGGIVALCAAGAWCAEGSTGEPTLIQRVAMQQARLAQVEQVVVREREQIEQWFQQQRAQVAQTIGRRAAARLGYTRNVRWVEFMRMHRGLPHADAYFDASQYGFVAGPPRFAYLRQAMEKEYFITEMANLLVSEPFHEKLTQIVNDRLDAPLQPLLREEARELLAVVVRVRADVATQVRQLENARRARLEATMEWERTLQEQVHGILQYLREQESKATDFGVVESIGYFPQTGYCCMVEGVDRVLQTGDTIGEVQVLRIDPVKVEFAKNGTTWAQPLGAPAQAHWQQSGHGG